MLGCTGSSGQDEALLRAEGLGTGPSLSWEDTLLTRGARAASGRSAVRTAMRRRHSSCKTAGGSEHAACVLGRGLGGGGQGSPVDTHTLQVCTQTRTDTHKGRHATERQAC